MTEILFKILDLLLGGLVSKYKDREKLRSNFDVIKRKIIYAGIVNELPVLLKELRDFLIENDLAEKEGISQFFSKWLNHPLVMQGIPAVNVYSSDEISDLKNEIDQLKL